MQNNKSDDPESDEAASLKKEFEWILTEEVRTVFKQLRMILEECIKRFPILRADGTKKQDTYVLIAPPDKLKTVLSISGDNISHGDLQFRVQRQHQSIIYRTYVQSEHPWKLYQIQDAANHLQHALMNIENCQRGCTFCSYDEVLHVVGKILSSLQRGRTSLVVPKKKTIPEILKSRNMNYVYPVLPDDLAVNFYIQSHKLVLAIYQINYNTKIVTDVYQSECTIPWLNEVLVLFTVALQLCQQLKDKVGVFAQYKDFKIESRRPSNVKITLK